MGLIYICCLFSGHPSSQSAEVIQPLKDINTFAKFLGSAPEIDMVDARDKIMANLGIHRVYVFNIFFKASNEIEH